MVSMPVVNLDLGRLCALPGTLPPSSLYITTLHFHHQSHPKLSAGFVSALSAQAQASLLEDDVHRAGTRHPSQGHCRPANPQ